MSSKKAPDVIERTLRKATLDLWGSLASLPDSRTERGKQLYAAIHGGEEGVSPFGCQAEAVAKLVEVITGERIQPGPDDPLRPVSRFAVAVVDKAAFGYETGEVVIIICPDNNDHTFRALRILNGQEGGWGNLKMLRRPTENQIRQAIAFCRRPTFEMLTHLE